MSNLFDVLRMLFVLPITLKLWELYLTLFATLIVNDIIQAIRKGGRR